MQRHVWLAGFGAIVTTVSVLAQQGQPPAAAPATVNFGTTNTLYTIPDPANWTVIVNRSTTQWGEEGSYTEAVRAQEVGRATVPAGTTAAHVETFTITPEPAEAGATDLVLEWEGSRIEIPVRRRTGP